MSDEERNETKGGDEPPERWMPPAPETPPAEGAGVPPEEAVSLEGPVVPAEPFDATGAPVPPRSRRPAAYAAVVVGLLAMTAGAIFFARSLGSSGGPGSPEEAVQQLFQALSNEDALGVLESLPGAEREVFSSRLQTLTTELGRLGILSADLNLGDIPGVDLEFSQLKLSAETLSQDLSAVSVNGGRLTYRVDPSRSPLGDFVRGLLPRDASGPISGTEDLSTDPIVLVTMREGDAWHVSLWYSIAEAARRDAGGALPQFGRGLAARGEATPEAAVEAMIRAAVALDVQRLIELMPPDEARALHDYAPLFIDAAKQGARGASGHFTATIKSLELSSSSSGSDEAIVKIRKMAFSVEIPELGMSLDYDGSCVTLKGEFFGVDTPQRQCGQGLGSSAGIPGLPTAPDIGFVAVQREGKWFVSPGRTILDGLIGVVKVLDREKLDLLKNFFGGFGALGGGAEQFGIPGVPLPEEFATMVPQT